MRLDASDIADLQPVIAEAVRETLDQIASAEKKLANDRLAFNEPEAAASIGVARHVLRDARLRGELKGSKPGKSVVYTRGELLRFLRRKQT